MYKNVGRKWTYLAADILQKKSVRSSLRLVLGAFMHPLSIHFVLCEYDRFFCEQIKS